MSTPTDSRQTGKGRRSAWPRKPCAAIFLAVSMHAFAADPAIFSAGESASDARFGAQLGAGSQWQSSLPGIPSGTGATFGGGVRLGCTGVDFNGFLHTFDPSELIGELRNSLLSGAQAAASDFLIALAYATPTVSSVLDMLDKRYSARFNAFSQACNAQADRARGQEAGARAMADASDECFGQEMARGTAPTEAYRRCSVLHAFDGLDVPAAESLEGFLRKYTSIGVTKDLQAILALLPDQRIEQGHLEVRPARLSVAALAGRLQALTRAALERIDSGADPSNVDSCSADILMGEAAAENGCLPPNAAPLVASAAFRGARSLGSASRALFHDALSSQLALETIYSDLLDLYQQASRIDVQGAGDAGHAASRRQQLQTAIEQLLREADVQVKAQDARARLVRLQMLALEHVESTLEARSRIDSEDAKTPDFGMRDLMQLFSAGD